LAINRGAGQPEPDTPSEPSEEPPVAEEEPEGSDTAQEDKSDRTGSKMWF
jgi:hypothetical protein